MLGMISVGREAMLSGDSLGYQLRILGSWTTCREVVVPGPMVLKGMLLHEEESSIDEQRLRSEVERRSGEIVECESKLYVGEVASGLVPRWTMLSIRVSCARRSRFCGPRGAVVSR